MPNPKTEPVMTLVLAELAAGIGLLAAFGVHLSDAQVFAITEFAQASLAVGLWVRSKVTPGSSKPVAPAAQTTTTGAA